MASRGKPLGIHRMARDWRLRFAGGTGVLCLG